MESGVGYYGQRAMMPTRLGRLAETKDWAALMAGCAAGRDPNDVKEFTDGGRTGGSFSPLVLAAREGATEEVIDALVIAGADIAWRDPNCGLTALHHSAIGGYAPATRALLRIGAPIDLRANGSGVPGGKCERMGFLGGIPLHVARLHEQGHRCEGPAGTDATVRNMAGRTPLDLNPAGSRRGTPCGRPSLEE